MRCEEADIPARMKKLDRDKRGYPVPFIVYRDKNGDPHFTINDSSAASLAISDKRCSVCGGKLGSNMWFIGGPQSAFHAKGAYIDPPVHKDCGRFALKTCPYIALPSWNEQKRIDAKTLKPGSAPEHMLLMDRTMIPDKPVVFVFGKTPRYSLTPAATGFGQVYLKPVKPWVEVEFWKDGKEITRDEAETVIREAGMDPEEWAYW